MGKQKVSGLVLVCIVPFNTAMRIVEVLQLVASHHELQVKICLVSFVRQISTSKIQRIMLYFSQIFTGLKVCHTARNPNNVSYFSSYFCSCVNSVNRLKATNLTHFPQYRPQHYGCFTPGPVNSWSVLLLQLHIIYICIYVYIHIRTYIYIHIHTYIWKKNI